MITQGLWITGNNGIFYLYQFCDVQKNSFSTEKKIAMIK